MRSVFPDTRPDALQIGTFFRLFRPFADKRPTPVAQRASSSSGVQPESSTASCAATSASAMKRSIFRWSLAGIHSFRSSRPSAFVPCGICPAILAGRSATSKD